MQGKFSIINSDKTLDYFIQELRGTYALRRWLMVQITTDKQRSRLQNNSLHLWLDMVCQELNERGLTVQQALEKAVDRDWTMPAAKELLWRPVQKAMTGQDSTTKITTKECTEIAETLNRHLGGNFGFYVSWPSKEAQQ